MKIEKLVLKNFRNIRDVTFYPDKRLNFLVGLNGQGKTSFIEAIGLLSTLRSFRDSKAISMIRWDERESQVDATVVAEAEDGALEKDASQNVWRTELKIILEKEGSSSHLTTHTGLRTAIQKNNSRATKTAFINGKAYRSSVQYLSQRFGSYELGFHTIIFNPSDHDLVRGDPATRRAYLDRVITAEDIHYLKALQRYQRVLQQRNALLKSSESLKSSLLREFTEPLCVAGIELTLKRLKWIERLSQRLNLILKTIAPNQPDLRLAYLSNWSPELDNLSYKNNSLDFIHFTGQGSPASLELLEKSFWTQAAALESAERKQGCSLVGPHRDDWAFFLGGHPLKGHGSQGEVRSALLALKLSEIELFRDETGHKPLFLLDDFSSELDQARRTFLLKFLIHSDLQTFITTTEDSSSMGKRTQINCGAIEEGSSYDDRKRTIQFE